MSLKFVSYQPRPAREIPRRPWLIPGLILRQQLTLLTGTAGIAKSAFSFHLAVMCATGRPWAHWKPKQRTRVLILSAEETYDEYERRLVAACHAMHVDRSSLADWIRFVMPERDGAQVSIVERRTTNGPIRQTEAFNQIVEQITADSYGLFVADPVIELSTGLDENSPTDLQQVAVALRQIARSSGAASLGVHHTKKHGEAANPENARGGGSLLGAARGLIGLDRAKAEDAARALGMEVHEIDSSDARVFVKVTAGKANYSPDGQSWWIRRSSVEVGNAGRGPNGEWEESDTAPAWEAFTMPSVEPVDRERGEGVG